MILDDFHGSNKNAYWLSDVELDDDGVTDSLIGFHTFKGNILLVPSPEN